VDTNPANPVIGTRSLSGDVGVVCELGSAMVRGFQDHGVAACAKHFPGHGDTSQDSHYDLPRLKHSMDRLEAVELKPFDSAVKAGVSSMMSAHVIFEPLDAKYPATMSRPALDGILRDRFGFRGVVFSDDLEMKAIADHYALEECLIRGLNAGIDVFLVCHHLDIQRRAADIIAQAVERGTVSPGRFREALTRIDGLMTQYCKPPASTYEDEILGCAHHQQVIDRLKKQVDSAALAAGKDPTEFLKIVR
jgi:beta-N-acetylhexosaminidase